MPFKHKAAATLASILICVSTASQAALVSRLSGLAVYDSDLDITWLADANYAQSSGHDSDGLMDWNDAVAWADSLIIDGIGDWRLPTTLQPDPSCGIQGGGGTLSLGLGCTGSEMGALFHNSLSDASGLFSNLESDTSYWSSSVLATDPSDAWRFSFDTGWQETDSRLGSNFYAWAVRDGDLADITLPSGGLAEVPLPPSSLLLGSGLLGLLSAGRRRRKNTA